jgi:hypothetical protein
MDSLFHGLKHIFKRDSLEMYLGQMSSALAATPDDWVFGTGIFGPLNRSCGSPDSQWHFLSSRFTVCAKYFYPTDKVVRNLAMNFLWSLLAFE